jgi:hypothetical protein
VHAPSHVDNPFHSSADSTAKLDAILAELVAALSTAKHGFPIKEDGIAGHGRILGRCPLFSCVLSFSSPSFSSPAAHCDPRMCSWSGADDDAVTPVAPATVGTMLVSGPQFSQPPLLAAGDVVNKLHAAVSETASLLASICRNYTDVKQRFRQFKKAVRFCRSLLCSAHLCASLLTFTRVHVPD